MGDSEEEYGDEEDDTETDSGATSSDSETSEGERCWVVTVSVILT